MYLVINWPYQFDSFLRETNWAKANSAVRESAATLQFWGTTLWLLEFPKSIYGQVLDHISGHAGWLPSGPAGRFLMNLWVPYPASRGTLLAPREDSSLLASVSWLWNSLAWSNPADLSTIQEAPLYAIQPGLNLSLGEGSSHIQVFLP